MKVVSAPPIAFTCASCGAVCEGQPDEFSPLNTMPPAWLARCAFCGCMTECSPKPLIVRTVGTLSPGEAIAIVKSRFNV